MLAHAIVLIATVTSASLLFVFLDISWLPGLEVSYFVFAWIIGRWRCDLCGDLARLQDAITFDPESGWRELRVCGRHEVVDDDDAVLEALAPEEPPEPGALPPPASDESRLR